MKYCKCISLILTVMITGCSDFLDKQPDDMKTDEMIWKSSAETEAYLYNVYSQVPLWGANVDPWLGLSDECDMSWNVYPTYSVNLGNWNPSTGLYNMWQPFYKAIRASFVFENNVDKCPELSDRLKRQYKAEVKFLRGFYYWQILKQYGPAVLITEQLPNGYDWNHFPRTPFDDCVAYICQMLDEAYPDLPLNWKSDRQWFGKADRTACLAIKSEVLLLAASEQWNGNPYYRNFVNPDGTPLAGRVYNESKWRKAADAAKEVIAIAETDPKADIRLYKNHENGDGTVFSPYKSVRDVLLMKWNCEILFGRQVFNYDSWEVHCSPGTYNLGGQAPTQRLVDAFYMKNGRIISDPLSGYVEEGFAATAGESWNPRNLNPVTDRIEMIRDIRNGDAWGHWAGDWNMYANREPRFYAAILYNKRIVPQFAEDVAKRDYFSSPGQKNGYARVELYYGGFSRGSGASTFYPRTGYLVLKNCDPQSNMCQGDRVYVKTQRQQTYIRYGGILLNYIEALNECDPNNADIEKYWNMIRERAGIPNIFVVYPDIKGNKLKQRELILRERQIELCFEFDRYFTTRRRWLANTPDDGSPTRQWGEGGKMWGMDINAGNAATNDFNFTGFYRRVAFEERVFSEKMCLFPIAQSELDKNNMMVQNPGW